MKSPLRRRDFLKASAAAVAAGTVLDSSQNTASAQIRPVPGGDKLTVYQVEPENEQVWVRWRNELLTSYRAHHSQKYPYLYPVMGPVSGLSLTTETSLPYPHHRSLLFACDHVNGGNYWQSNLAAGQILSTGPKLGVCTETSAEILDACEWGKPGETPVSRDQRKITIRIADERTRFIDFDIRWTAVEDMTVTRTNHSLFSIRSAGDISVWGGGTLINSEGQKGEKATFGQPAAWCGYHGKRKAPADVVEGIAILDHPENPWAPCPWFTRDYGFISPTPFNFIDKPWQLAAGKSVRLRYRVVLHAGDHKDAALDALHKEWAAAI